MSSSNRTSSVSHLIQSLKDEFEIRPVGQAVLTREVAEVVLMQSSTDKSLLESALVVLPALHDLDAAREWSNRLGNMPCVLLLPTSLGEAQLAKIFAHQTLLLAAENLAMASFVVECTRLLDPAEEHLARKLAGIQAKFNLALTHPEPLQDLFRRVSKQLGGTVALIGSDNRIHASSGPLPLNQVAPFLEDDASPLIRIETEQWRGAAVRVATPSYDDDSSGWLVGLVRVPRSFESSQVATLQLAAPVFDTLVQLRQASHEEDRAAGAAILGQALAFRPQRNHAELQGKLLAHRISFEEQLYVVVFGLSEFQPQTQRRHLSRLEIEVQSLLSSHSIPHLTTEADQTLVCLVQASVDEIHRIMESNHGLLHGTRATVGRLVKSVGDIADSHQDAVLRLRSGKFASDRFSLTSAEDFDFAFRLFSEIGLDRAAAWAKDFLEPLWDRELLLEGIQAFFAHEQNVNAAADALSIHHNSLRYRLSKVEAALDFSLRSPSGVASLFLALTALELGGVLKPFDADRNRQDVNHAASGTTVVPGSKSGASPASGLPGVVLGPNG